MDASGSRVAVELIDSESDCRETINSILLQAFHPTATLTPELPNVSDKFSYLFCILFMVLSCALCCVCAVLCNMYV